MNRANLLRTPLVAALLFALGSCKSTAAFDASQLQPIGRVQGSDATSPLQGQQVQVAGVVTARIKTDNGVLYSLQDEGDGDEGTSDALFLQGAPDTLKVGVSIAVTGTVVELDTENNSRITALQVTSLRPISARPMPAARQISQAPESENDWEKLEAMRVKITVPLTLTGNHHATQFGRWHAAFGERLWVPTEIALPGDAANRLEKQNRARSLWLADAEGRSAMRRTVPRLGSQLRNAEGIIDERYSRHILQLTQPLAIDALPRPAAPARQGALRIASFNLENLFNGDGKGGGFIQERGAKSFQDYQRQLASHVAALSALDADIITLMELENDGQDPLSAESQLLEALNAQHGGDWRAVPITVAPSEIFIRNGVFYRSSKVKLLETPLMHEKAPFTRLNRPSIAARFQFGNSQPFVVIVNHLKSKGCRNARDANADQNDGQVCWNATRMESVQQLHALTQTHFAGQPVVMLGDFNAYAMEDPPRWLLAQGWQDAFAATGTKQIYSYVYEGQAGRLDHAFVNPGMRRWLQAAHVWHINTDEVERNRNTPIGPERSSDHDPVLVDFTPQP